MKIGQKVSIDNKHYKVIAIYNMENEDKLQYLDEEKKLIHLREIKKGEQNEQRNSITLWSGSEDTSKKIQI